MKKNKNLIEYKGKNIIILSCSDCNVKCKHCYISYKGNYDGEILYNFVDILKDKYEVRINGSEPLIHPEYIKSFNRIGQYGPLTNGLIFKNNYTYLDVLKENNMKELYISYHFDWHNQISKVDKEYLHELFKEIKKRNMNFIIMCTITSKNYMKVLDYCKEALELGAYGIKFTNFLLQGQAKNLDMNLILTTEQKQIFLELIESVRNQYDEDKFFIKRCGSFGTYKLKINKFKCIAGVDNICIAPNKNIYPCVFLAKPGNEIGKVINDKPMIYESFSNDGTICLADEICNRRSNWDWQNVH